MYLCMKVSLSPDVILCGWLGLKFFRSYFCLIGPFNHISLYESLPQPQCNSLWLTGLKAPTNQTISSAASKRNRTLGQQAAHKPSASVTTTRPNRFAHSPGTLAVRFRSVQSSLRWYLRTGKSTYTALSHLLIIFPTVLNRRKEFINYQQCSMRWVCSFSFQQGWRDRSSANWVWPNSLFLTTTFSRSKLNLMQGWKGTHYTFSEQRARWNPLTSCDTTLGTKQSIMRPKTKVVNLTLSLSLSPPPNTKKFSFGPQIKISMNILSCRWIVCWVLWGCFSVNRYD